MDALYDYYRDTASSSPASSNDLTVPMENLELDDWHQDLHDQIEWMREVLLPEIKREYLDVCKVWFENRVSALEEDKIFLEDALKFLSLTRDDEIKWTKNECLSFVTRIKSYALHLRDLSYGNLPAKYQTPEHPQQLNKVSTESLSSRKWPKLAMQHDLMIEEFLSLKKKYLPIVSQAFTMYCKFCNERGEKYYPLMWNFAFCTTFLRRSEDEVLLISRDVFDSYAKRIKMLVIGVDRMESFYNINCKVGAKECLLNNDFATESAHASASSNSTVLSESGSADWHDELHREIELMRKAELRYIKWFYLRVRKLLLAHQEKLSDLIQSEPVDQLEQDKRSLEFALKFLAVRRSAKISWSKKACFEVVDAIKLYALRYKNEYVAKQYRERWLIAFPYANSEGSRDDSVDDWRDELLRKVELMREKYISELEEAHRRVCLVQTESMDSTIIRGDEYFLTSALRFLRITTKDEITNPKDISFALLKRIEVYVVRYRYSDIARQSKLHHADDEQCQELKMEVEVDDDVNPSLTVVEQPASIGSKLERQSSWLADEARPGIPRATSDPGCMTRHWQQEHPSGNQPQFVLGA